MYRYYWGMKRGGSEIFIESTCIYFDNILEQWLMIFLLIYLIKKSYTGSFMLNESSKIVQASNTSAILLKL